MKRLNRNSFAFTLLELMVVLTVLCVLLVLLLAVLGRANAKAQRILCVNNLKNIGLAYRLTSNEPGKSFLPTNSVPKSFDDLVMHWKSLTNEFAFGAWMTCRSDTRQRAAGSSLARTNASYFVGLDAAMPQDILMGDRNITTNGVSVGPGVLRIDPNLVMGWDRRIHKFQGNVAMGDGSVMQANSGSLTKLFRASRTNTLAVP